MAIQIEANLSLRNTRYASETSPNLLYNCRKYSTNHTFLCKTKPILKSYQCPQTLYRKQLAEIFTTFCNRKTKPIQSQTKPISKMTKINANPFKKTTYEKFCHFLHPKNKANFKKRKNERKLFTAKGLRAKTGLKPQKNKAKQSQFPKRQKMNANSFITKDYENNPLLEPKKTKPNKPNFYKPKMGTKTQFCSAVFGIGGKYHNHIIWKSHR